jgi:tRNA G37 N-methylase TrmD
VPAGTILEEHSARELNTASTTGLECGRLNGGHERIGKEGVNLA